MSNKAPHIENLLKKVSIEKPQEEFILPNPEPSSFLPPNVSPDPFTTTSAVDSVQSLVAEAQEVQTLIDLVINTTPEIEVSVPTTEAQIIGASITTRQYIDALNAGPTDPKANRITKAFETGVLESQSENWAVLMLGDMFDIRDTLVSVSNVMIGNTLSSTNITSGQDWAELSTNSHMSKIQDTAIQNSINFRSKFLHTSLTLSESQLDGFLGHILDPVLLAHEAEVRQKLIELRGLLDTIRHILRFSIQTRMAEFHSIRDTILSYVKSKVVSTLIQALVVLLSKAVNKLVNPVVSFLEGGFSGGTPLIQAEDFVAQQVAGVLVDSVYTMTTHYTNIAADLIREQNIKSNLSLQKLQVLGEHTGTNKWIQQLDQSIALIDRALSTSSNTIPQKITSELFQDIRKAKAKSQSKLLDQAKQTWDLEALALSPFIYRSTNQ